MADRTGQRLGNYNLVRLLGRGGFAEVYLGEHVRLGTEAAIKVLYTQVEGDDANHFLQEARTVARLIHPHIVRIFDFDVQEGVPFLVMDYAPNGTLRHHHSKGVRLPLDTIVSYIKQVTDALQYAHDEKLIHRDIKPENMLVGRRNELLLSDFGIALIAQSTRMQSTQEVVGTAYYMAPEQLQGKPRLASDQYALGVVVYEWLTGDRPFLGSFSEIASQHMFVPPPSIHEKLPSISPSVEEVIMTALAKDPHQRFGSVRAFATALEQASQSLAATIIPSDLPPTVLVTPSTPPVLTAPEPDISMTDAPVSSQQSGTVPPPQPHTRFDPQPVTAPTSGSVRSHYDLPPTVPVASISLSAITDPIAGTELSQKPVIETALCIYRGHSNSVYAIAWSPDGYRIASGGYDGTVQIWNATDGGQVVTYRNHFNTVYAIAWSPNGQLIASGSYDGTVQIWNAIDGSHVLTYRGHLNTVTSVAWSLDGKHIASGGTSVQIWNTTDGSHVLTYKGHLNTVKSVVWSPDGQRIASSSDDRTVQVWRVADGGQAITYKGHSDTVTSIAWSPDGKCIVSGAGGFDKTVQVWKAASGSHTFTYTGHTDTVKSVAWSPDGKRIVSGGNDKTAQIWNATDGSTGFIYKGHSDSVNAVAWSPDGQHIASGSGDYTVQVWKAV